MCSCQPIERICNACRTQPPSLILGCRDLPKIIKLLASWSLFWSQVITAKIFSGVFLAGWRIVSVNYFKGAWKRETTESWLKTMCLCLDIIQLLSVLDHTGASQPGSIFRGSHESPAQHPHCHPVRWLEKQKKPFLQTISLQICTKACDSPKRAIFKCPLKMHHPWHSQHNAQCDHASAP